MIEFMRHLFAADFMPHGMCYLWNPAVLWLNVISDSTIAASYYAIPFLLFYFNRRRRDISFHWIFVAFGLFILACGTTHLLGAVTVWQPVYRLDGAVKAITAVVSLATFFMMIPLMPVLVKLPSPSELAKVNEALGREIQERRAAEAEVRKINEELEARVEKRTAEHRDLQVQLLQAQKMEAVGRLAGGVAHDFNNLLTVILGYTELLTDQVKGDPQGLEAVREVSQAAERASALTGQLLAFSRRQVSMPRIVNLNDQVQLMEKMLRRIIGEDVELSIRLDRDLWPVNLDPTHIDQIIMNLAVNSRDAMPNGGRLSIGTANVDITAEYAGGHLGLTPGPYVMLAVSDTGVGMDAATRSRIFEPFFTTKEHGRGTGLGLSIVYGVVKQNGGEILVYSEPGHGSVFRIYFPAAADALAALPAAAPEAAEERPSETILLVEDEEQVRRLTRKMLERLGYRVFDAASAASALEFVRSHPDAIDLLLTDVVMPHMGGPELEREVRLQRPGIKVLFMSGYTEEGVVNQRMLTPDTPFIQKPFSMAGLRRKIREVLRR
jgi:signal transduction histidine kinase/CheY-like chemotaxis protein